MYTADSATPLRIDRQLRAFNLAKACAALGARVRTIGYLTGLPSRELLRLLFPNRQVVPRGRPPASPEWYYGANLLHRTEASIVVVLHQRLRRAGFAAPEALVGAYHHYQKVCESPLRISFDRAFDLVAHTEGVWLTNSRSFGTASCPECHCDYLAAFGAIARSNHECPFCKLVQRYGADQRVKAAYPTRTLPRGCGRDVGMLPRLWHDCTGEAPSGGP
jgi:flagellar transcriptional activator FlhC